MTIKELAAEKKVHEKTLRNWIRAGLGPDIHEFGPKNRLIKKSDAELWDQRVKRPVPVK
ncbi:MAG TPA: hypothetical protein V6C81_21275 [Planktothrix sp.]